jgi:RNA polymerase sigma factor (sigma-70 family)
MDDIRSSPDRDLVDAVLANRPGAFERLIREYQGLCWHIIQRMVRNPEDARELCQDTFLRVHQCLHQYRYESALKSWIGRVAYTIALRHLQHKRIPLVEHGDGDDYALVENIATASIWKRPARTRRRCSTCTWRSNRCRRCNAPC